MRPYPYQEDLIQQTFFHYGMGARYVLMTLATGAGKTPTFCFIALRKNVKTLIIVHKEELLLQVSSTLARMGVKHSLICPGAVAKRCVGFNTATFNRSFITPESKIYIGSVDTLYSRLRTLKRFLGTVKFWVIDEAHHALEKNTWGRVVAEMKNAEGLGVTATWFRGDRRSLKRGHGGLFETISAGPDFRDVVKMGYLTDYRIFAPESSVIALERDRGAMNEKQLLAESNDPAIIGDLVRHYERFTPGETGITFTSNLKNARHMAGRYKQAGIPAVSLDAKTPGGERARAIADLKSGILKQIVNYGLFGEGTDIPQVSVVCEGRPTGSMNVFHQHLGRAIRAFPGKNHGTYIDAVGNWQLGLPDALGKPDFDTYVGKRALKRVEKPVRRCLDCFHVWEGYALTCPACGARPSRAPATEIKQIEGDLTLLDLNSLRGHQEAIAERLESPKGAIDRAGLEHAAAPVRLGFQKRFNRRREALQELRETISFWGGKFRDEGLAESERYVKFFHDFGVDVLTAQLKSAPELEKLNSKIKEVL